MRRTDRENGFTLIELIAVCAVIGLLVAIAAPAIGWQQLQSRCAAESAHLQRLAAAVQASFESSDLESTNLAAIAGSIPAGVDPTAFSSSTDPSFIPSTTNPWDWFAKVTRQMGDSPQIGIAPTPALQPRTAAVLINPDQNARLMLIGPTSESTQQRFLLVSLMAPSGELAMPPLPDPSNPQDPANIALFDDIWNTDWTNSAAVLPPSWTSALSAQQVMAWQGNGAGPGRLWQLCVQRIVCPKYSLTVNDTHPTDNCYVYYNLNGSTAGSTAVVPANSGACVIQGILSGRVVQAYRGASPPPAAQLFSQFNLRDYSEITLQD